MKRIQLAATIALTVLVGISTAADKRETLGPQLLGKDLIHSSLAGRFSMDIVEMPLTETISFFEKQTKLKIELDKDSLEDEGIALDSPVTMSLKNVSVETAFHFVLGPLGLDYSVTDKGIEVTTKTKLERKLVTKQYSIGELAKQKAEHESLMKLIRSNSSTSQLERSWRGGNGPKSKGETDCLPNSFASSPNRHVPTSIEASSKSNSSTRNRTVRCEARSEGIE